MTARFGLAKRKARELLARGGVSEAPVPVERLAELVGADIQYEPYTGELAGMLLRRGSRAVIGVNHRDSKERQRFSIAHEIGHLILHRDEEFHLDERNPIQFRNAASATGEDDTEVEANQFAAELLMPQAFLARDVPAYRGEDVDVAIPALARRYRVSEQAMTIRLGVLRYIG